MHYPSPDYQDSSGAPQGAVGAVWHLGDGEVVVRPLDDGDTTPLVSRRVGQLPVYHFGDGQLRYGRSLDGRLPPKRRRYNPAALAVVTDVIRHCPDRYFITLTTKRRLDDIALSAAVGQTIHRANCALFGPAYKRKRKLMLATYVVQERSIQDGLHAHLLIGVVSGSLAGKANPCPTPVPNLITSLWVDLDDHGFRSAKAQDAQEITDFDGALRYVTKTIHELADVAVVDLMNTKIPPTI